MPKKSITTLYREFETAIAALDAEPYWRTNTGKKKYDAALDRCCDLSVRIVATPADPANPIPEMLLKIKVGGWWNGTGEPLDQWTECADLDIAACVVSLRKDLQAMLGKPPRRARRSAVRTRVADQVAR
jgi:hypothetical protein